MLESFEGRHPARGPRRWVRELLGGSAMAALLLTLTSPLAAQQVGTVVGRVIDGATSQPIAGAQAVVVGTQMGRVSNNRGVFNIPGVAVGPQRVRVLMLGYGEATRDVVVQAGAVVTVEFELFEKPLEMDALVVTGTPGAARRREIGNTIAQINAGQLQDSPILTPADALQGMAAGVQVLGNSGMVGAASTIRLRGNTSVTAGNDPLIYVDGVRMSSRTYGWSGENNQAASPLNDISPNDIERVEVIKGAAATTLYGTEAAGGVIQIFTKRGASGNAAWTMSMDQGFNSLGHVGPASDPSGLNMNDCTLQDPPDPSCPPSGTWLRRGYVQRYNLSVRGGAEQMSYFLSGNYGNELGALPNQGQNGFGARGNFTFSPRDNLSIQFNSAYTRRVVDWIPDGNNAEGFTTNVFRGDRGVTPNNEDALALDMKLKTAINHAITGVAMIWTPTTSFSHHLNVGIDYTNSDYTEFRPWGFYYRQEGNRTDILRSDRSLTLDYAGTWSQDLPAGLSSSFSWGVQGYDNEYNSLTGFGEYFAGPGEKLVDSGSQTQASEGRTHTVSGGFFLQETAGWRNRLFLTAGARWDGFSSFGQDFGLAFYPKLSIAYLLSEETWFPGWFETFKLRAAVGESGKAPGPFDALRTWTTAAGDEGQPALTVASIGSPNLGPERTREWEAGFDGSWLNSRITAQFTYFNQHTYDALIPVQLLPSTGMGVFTQVKNVGDISNTGTETTLGVNPVQTPVVNWDLGFRYSTINSMVNSLAEGLPSIYIGWRNEARPGYPLPSYFHVKVTNPDAVGVAPIIESDQYIGPSYPSHTWSANTSVSLWGRITLQAMGEYEGGQYLQNGTGYQQMRRGQWAPCLATQEAYAANPSTDKFAGLKAGDVAKCISSYSGYGIWTMPAKFFKLRSASVSYRLPDNWLGNRFESATISLQGRNLWTVTNYDGLDPEAAQAGSAAMYRMEYYNLPPLRSFLVNLRVTF